MVRPAVIEYVLVNGEAVKLAVNMYGLSLIRDINDANVKRGYKAISTIMMSGTDEILTCADALYGAYVIGHVSNSKNDGKPYMSYPMFLQNLGDNWDTINKAIRYLLLPNLRTVSESASESAQEAEKAEE